MTALVIINELDDIFGAFYISVILRGHKDG